MKLFRIAFLSAVVLTLLSVSLPSAAHAANSISVNQTDPACSTAASTTTTVYCNIQPAIDTAVTNSAVGYSVLVEPGTYNESITLHGITVEGRETARTFLSGTVTADAGYSGSPRLSRFFLTGSSTSVVIQSSATLDITNNIFYGLTTAVQVAGSGSIVNNVFYSNTTGISTSVSIEITNNIFLSNSTAIAASITLTNVTNNDFYGNATNGFSFSTPDSANHNIINSPSVVSQTGGDFHLQTGSPCIDAGNSGITDSFDTSTSDIGAYGGTNPDTIMFMISGLTGTVETSNSISLSWNANNDYRRGGYHVYYGNSSGAYTGTDAAEGISPITVTGTSALLSGLTATATPLSTAPTLTVTNILNQSLEVSWDAITGATGYIVYYGVDDGTQSAPTASSVVIYDNATTTATLTGLTNNQNYKIVVYAYSQAIYYIAVTAIDNTTGPFTQGIEHESAYSAELTAQLGTTEWSPVSNMVVDFPEALVAYPNLPSTGQGCFIATAAYGFYSSPQVQALRTFRDRYLATNSVGKAFVGFYYRYSPSAAAWLNDHPGFKPAVRAGLMPFVGAALFMTKTSLLVKIAVLTMIILLAGFAIRRKRMFAARSK